MSEPSPLDGGVKEVVNNLVNDLYGFAKTQLTGAKVKILTRFTDVFKNYLEISHKRLSKVKSFFVRDESIDLSSVYVKMNLSPNRSYREEKSINKVGFLEVKNIKSHIIVSGSAGSGKSFLMRHLFLDCIRDGLYIPIFVELKLLKDENQSLENLIIASINSYGGKLTFDYVDTLANLGRIFFIFDGFDEVNHILQNKISKNIKDFGEKYHKSIVILTSRPSENLLNWANFKNFNIDNLTLEQSLDLVKRLPFNPEIKSKFSQKLKAGLFEEHKSFLSNPLLLSIMLLTFSQNADVPKRISIFYQQAYEALFHKHDALKEGFIRGIKTNFDIVDFGKIFSWFAIITYKTRDFSFTYERIIEILKGIKASSQYNFDEREMLHDLTQSTSLIVEDGNLYVFTHRSFQGSGLL